jgi:hypothetical protein
MLDLDFKEYNKLKDLLNKKKIPFKEYDANDSVGKVLKVELPMGELSCAFHSRSFGSHRGLLEIMYGLTEEEYEYDDIKGYLTAKGVANRFSYCYKNKTLVYKN